MRTEACQPFLSDPKAAKTRRLRAPFVSCIAFVPYPLPPSSPTRRGAPRSGILACCALQARANRRTVVSYTCSEPQARLPRKVRFRVSPTLGLACPE